MCTLFRLINLRCLTLPAVGQRERNLLLIHRDPVGNKNVLCRRQRDLYPFVSNNVQKLNFARVFLEAIKTKYCPLSVFDEETTSIFF